MSSENKKIEKKQDTPKKGKAYVDTSDSKVVKGSNKAEIEKDKVVVESYDTVKLATNLEEFLRDLARLRDELHDFAVDGAERSQLTVALYEKITGKKVEPIYDENGDEDEFVMNFDEFRVYWDEIEEVAKTINPEKMNEIIEEFKYDLDGYYKGESFKQDLINALNEAISDKTMKASDVNKWLKENNLKDVISKIKSKKGKYNVDDIVKLISNKEVKKLQSDIITNIDNLNENVGDEPTSKYNIGDEVYYIPKISGMDNKKALIIKYKTYKKPDSLLGEETQFDWYYSFENSNLSSVESDLTNDITKLNESVATEDEIDMEDDNEDGKEEKDSSNTPEPAGLKENIDNYNDIDNDEEETDTELSSDDDNFDQDEAINEEEEEIDSLHEFKEMARNSESLADFINAIRNKKDVPSEISTEFFNKYGENGETPEQASEALYKEVKNTMNENIHQEMKRLIHLMALKENANELVNKFGLTNIKAIKESLVEELTDKEYEIVLEDVYTALNIKVENDFTDKTESINESLRSDLHDKLI